MNYGVSVLRMQQQDAKRLGHAQAELIEGAKSVGAKGKGANAPGIGGRVDVSA